MRMLHEDHSTAVRLAYIDFRLRFTGVVNRSDLRETFGLAEAAASKVLSVYKSRCPENMFYNRAVRANTILIESYRPLFSINAITALEMLASGFDKSRLINSPVLPFSRIGHISDLLDSENVAKITRAMNGGYAIKCNYLSGHRHTVSERTLLPVALMYDGRFWNFRAYDRNQVDENAGFKNFSFARAVMVEELFDAKHQRLNHEELTFDHTWNNYIPLVLQLHENLSDEERSKIRRDFGMKDAQNELVVTQRESELWILFKQWFIDTSDVTLDLKNDRFYKFRLINKDTVDALISASSANI